MPPRRKRTRVEDDASEPKGEATTAEASTSQAEPQGTEAAEAKRKQLEAFAEQWHTEGKSDEEILGMSSMSCSGPPSN